MTYDLTIALTKWAYYYGTNLIKFELTEVPTLLNIDFAGNEIAKVEVNGSRVDPIFERNKIQIYVGLKKGENRIRLSFYNKYQEYKPLQNFAGF